MSRNRCSRVVPIEVHVQMPSVQIVNQRFYGFDLTLDLNCPPGMRVYLIFPLVKGRFSKEVARKPIYGPIAQFLGLEFAVDVHKETDTFATRQ